MEVTEVDLNPGLLAFSLASGVIITAMVFIRKFRVDRIGKKSSDTEVEEFEDINVHLQNDLNKKLLMKIKEVKQEILFKEKQKDKNMKHLLKQQEDEIAIKQSQFMIEKLEIESRYKEKLELLEKEVTADINYLKDSLKNLNIILANSTDNADTLTNSRSELECPVCLEEMRPPKKIWQCSDGHAICDFCRKKPTVTCCPVCRKYIVGRSNIAEKLARCVFGGKSVEELQNSKITLTGYREVS